MGRIPRCALVVLVSAMAGCNSTGDRRPAETTTAKPKANADPAAYEKAADYLVGPWHEPSWKEVVLTVERTGPTSFRLIEKSNDGQTRTRNGELILVDDGAFLDVTNPAARPGAPASHQLVKLGRGFMMEVGVGGRAKSKEFHHSPFKRYTILHILPLQATYLAKHPEALRHEVRTREGSTDTDLLITASPAEIVTFLEAHGDDRDAWADEDRSPALVRR